MVGVRVLMIRANAGGVSPAERSFGDADGWAFADDLNTNTLRITKSDPPDAEGNFARRTIAEFPSSGIESVEFV